jgi:hypothetical protein
VVKALSRAATTAWRRVGRSDAEGVSSRMAVRPGRSDCADASETEGRGLTRPSIRYAVGHAVAVGHEAAALGSDTPPVPGAYA